MRGHEYALLRGARPSRPPYVPRGPLQPMPPGSYDRTLPFTPPAGPSLDFYRGNFCGVRIPGLPLRPGMSGYTVPGWRDNAVGGLNPPIMALDVFRYRDSRELRLQQLDAHASRGYTHFQCSVGHAIMCGWTIDEYVAFAADVQAVVGYADHWFLGGAWGLDPAEGGGEWNHDRDSEYWRQILDPWIDALLINRVIDAACVGWQLDGSNAIGRPIISIIDYFADRLRPQAIPIGTHWRNEAGGWWDPSDPTGPHNRFEWWSYFVGKLRWFHHQGDHHVAKTDVPLYQAKLCDTLNPFGDGRMGPPNTFALVVYECTAEGQFDVDVPEWYLDEDGGDLRGYLFACTRAASHVGGYGNGGRLLNGSLL